MHNKRQAILDTATRLFEAHGYHAIGIDRITNEAGVAKMTMYKHFASKRALICAVLKERDIKFQKSLSDFVGTFHEPREQLKAVFTWYDRWFNEASFNGCLFISAASEYPDQQDEIHLISKLHKQNIQSYIIQILTLIAPVIDEKVAQRLGEQLLQILEGAIIGALIFNHKNTVITASRTASAILKAERLI